MIVTNEIILQKLPRAYVRDSTFDAKIHANYCEWAYKNYGYMYIKNCFLATLANVKLLN